MKSSFLFCKRRLLVILLFIDGCPNSSMIQKHFNFPLLIVTTLPRDPVARHHRCNRERKRGRCSRDDWDWRMSSCSIRLRAREAERTYARALDGSGRSSNWATCSLPDPAEMHMVKSGEGINGQDLGLKPHLVCDDRAITSCFRYFCTRGP